MKATTTSVAKNNDAVLAILAAGRSRPTYTSGKPLMESAGEVALTAAATTVSFAGQIASVASSNHFAIGRTAGSLFNAFEEQRKIADLARRYNMTPEALASHIMS